MHLNAKLDPVSRIKLELIKKKLLEDATAQMHRIYPATRKASREQQQTARQAMRQHSEVTLQQLMQNMQLATFALMPALQSAAGSLARIGAEAIAKPAAQATAQTPPTPPAPPAPDSTPTGGNTMTAPTTITTPLTERQHELIMAAYCETGGWIEPLLSLKGGARMKMISSLAERGMIAKLDDQWCITEAARRLLEEDPETLAGRTAPAPIAPLEGDPQTEEAVALAEAQWQADKADNDAYDRAVASTKAGAAIRKAQAEALQNLRPGSKQAQVLEMLRRPKGTTIDEIMAVTGWQAHTVRGTFAATFKKRLGLDILSEKVEADGSKGRRYRIDGSELAIN